MPNPVPPAAHPEPQGLDEAFSKLTRGAGRLEAKRAGKAAPLKLERILVATDGSHASKHAVGWGREMAHAFGAGRITVLHAVPHPDLADHYLAALGAMGGEAKDHRLAEEFQERGRDLLEEAAQELRKAGLGVDAVLATGPPAREIVREATDRKADLVILGSHGRGPTSRAFLGGVADNVKNHVRAAVLIARTPAPPVRILAAVDGSRLSRRAAGLALRLGHAWNAPTTVFHAFEPLAYGPDAEMMAPERAALGEFTAAWGEPNSSFDVALGPPVERILEEARREGHDLVVLGSRGLGGIQSLVAGSVSSRVAHRAKASVLIVKEVRRG